MSRRAKHLLYAPVPFAWGSLDYVVLHGETGWNLNSGRVWLHPGCRHRTRRCQPGVRKLVARATSHVDTELRAVGCGSGALDGFTRTGARSRAFGSALRFGEMTVQFEPQKAQDSAGNGSNADRYARGQRGHATLRGELQNASGSPTRTSNTGTDRGRRRGLDLLAPVFVHNIWILAHPASPAAVSTPSERGYGRSRDHSGGLHHSPSHRARIWLDRREQAS